MREFSEVFANDLPGIPPRWEIDFGINLLPDTNPISISPYRMAPTESKELKSQLKDLLTKASLELLFLHRGSNFVFEQEGWFPYNVH